MVTICDHLVHVVM